MATAQWYQSSVATGLMTATALLTPTIGRGLEQQRSKAVPSHLRVVSTPEGEQLQVMLNAVTSSDDMVRFEVVQLDTSKADNRGAVLKRMAEAKKPVATLAALSRGVARVRMGLSEDRVVIGIVATSFDEDLSDKLDECAAVVALGPHVSFRYAWPDDEGELAQLDVIWSA